MRIFVTNGVCEWILRGVHQRVHATHLQDLMADGKAYRWPMVLAYHATWSKPKGVSNTNTALQVACQHQKAEKARSIQ